MPRTPDLPIPEGLELWTADEICECVGYRAYLSKTDADALDRKLWGFVNEATNPTPLGGDGSDGTVEDPDARRNPSNDDKPRHWWPRLTVAEQTAIQEAWKNEL